jgi:uncharacterized protein (DUF433 family)
MQTQRITRDPAVMGGKPCIRGMRVTVGMIVGQLGSGRSMEDLLIDYPYIERDDILEAMRYAEKEIDPRRTLVDNIAAMTPKGVKQTDSTLLIREDRDSWL